MNEKLQTATTQKTHTMKRSAFISPPSEYYTDFEDEATDVAKVRRVQHLEAAADAAGRCGAQVQSPIAAAGAVAQTCACVDGNVSVFAVSSPDAPTFAAAAAARLHGIVPADDAQHNEVAVEAAMQGIVELFISNSSAEPVYELRGALGRGKYGRVFLVEECVRHRLLAVKATYDPNWIAAVRHGHQQRKQLQTAPKGSDVSPGLLFAPQQFGLEDNGGAAGRLSPLPASTHLSSEVLCLQECSSPFIVRLDGAEKGENGEDLLLMEYVDCGDLRQEIRRRAALQHPFTETEVAFVFLQLCMAVDHVHQRNILHHDLKPENIMLSSTGIIKLGDFGFARKYTEPVSRCVASTGCGTPYYLSPEALRGERYSLKSEMWSLGVILYELMALTGPFVAASRNDLRRKVHEGHYASLPTVYTAELRAVCSGLLQLDPEARPSTQELFSKNEYLREMLNALRRTSECSTKMSAEEKGAMFYGVSAALRRRSPVSPLGVAGATATVSSHSGGSWNTSSSQGSYSLQAAVATPKPRFEREIWSL